MRFTSSHDSGADVSVTTTVDISSDRGGSNEEASSEFPCNSEQERNREARKEIRRQRIFRQQNEQRIDIDSKGASVEVTGSTEANHEAIDGSRVETKKRAVHENIRHAMKSSQEQTRQHLHDITDIRIGAIARERERRINHANRLANVQLLFRDHRAGSDTNSEEDEQQEHRRDAAEMDQPPKHDDAILKQQDSLILQLELQLLQMDEEYTLLIRDQGRDISELHSQIQANTKVILCMYDKHTEVTEQAHLAGRDGIIRSHRTEVEALVAKRSVLRRRQDKAEDELRDTRRKDIHDTTDHGFVDNMLMKAKLDRDIELLQHRLHELQSSFGLRIEKIDYEVNSLSQRQGEKTYMVQRHRKRILRAKEKLTQAIADYEETKAKNNSKLNNMANSCARVVRQCKEVGLNLSRLDLSEKKKSENILLMHEDDIRQLVKSINDSESQVVCAVLDHERVMEPSGLNKGGGQGSFSTDSLMVVLSDGFWYQLEQYTSDYHVALKKRSKLQDFSEALQKEIEKRRQTLMLHDLTKSPDSRKTSVKYL